MHKTVAGAINARTILLTQCLRELFHKEVLPASQAWSNS